MSKLDEFRDHLMRWRGEGLPLDDISMRLMEYGVDASTSLIHLRLKQWGAPPQRNRGRCEVHAERDAKIYRLHVQHGLDCELLAERFGLDKRLVGVILSTQKKMGRQ